MKKTAVKLKHTDFNMKEHGFVGHLAEPEQTNGKAVIVIMGGEQSLLPGIKIAERFADHCLAQRGFRTRPTDVRWK